MTDKAQNLPENTADNVFNRQKLLILSSSVLEKIEQRLTTERFRSSESDNTYLAFVRAFSSLMTAHNMTLRDNDLDAINRRLDEIEARQRGDNE